MKDDKLYLINIKESIEKIETYTKNGKKEFLESSVIQDAVIRNFEIIGEATKQISTELRTLYPDVPWRRVAGFRDVLIHQYMGLEMEEIWSNVADELPEFKQTVLRILNSLDRS